MNNRHRSPLCFVALVLSGLPFAPAARADLGVPISQRTPIRADDGIDPTFNREPVIATDGDGLWIAAWQESSTVAYAGFEVFVARSVDSGGHWSAPVPLNPNAFVDTNGDTGPSIATDGQGRWVAVWQSAVPDSTGVQSEIKTARSIDNGANWSLPTPVNANAAADPDDELDPAVGTDGQGHWIAAWRTGDANSSSTTAFDIVYTRSIDNGANWTSPLPLSGNLAFDSIPRMATDGQGHWVVVWAAAGRCIYVRSIDNGENWSAPALLSTNGSALSNEIQPDVSADGGGHWVALWSSNDTLGGAVGANRKILVARSVDHGASWSGPAPLSTPAAPEFDSQPSLTTDRQGNWAAVWHRANKTAGKTDVIVARSIDEGATWSSPSVLDTIANGDTTSFPRIATDGRGEWVTAWHTQDASFNSHVFSAHFGLPDCNSNLVGDPLETAAGISPDINNNRVPDFCEVLGLPPAGSGCGGGPCGVGAAAFAPVTLLAATRLRRSSRRARKGDSNV